MTTPLPWFRFHANYLADWRIGGRGPSVVAAFVQALAALWASEDCALPADPAAFAMAARIDDRTAAEAVRELMAPHPDQPSLVTFPALLDEWREVEQRREQCSIAGRRSAVRRMSGRAIPNDRTNERSTTVPTDVATSVQRPLQPAFNDRSNERSTDVATTVQRVRVREREELKSDDDARERAPAREERATQPPPPPRSATSDDEGEKKPIAEKPTPAPLWDDDEPEPARPAPPAKPLNGSARTRAEEDARLDALLSASEAMPRLGPAPDPAPQPAPVVDASAPATASPHAADARRVVDGFVTRAKIRDGAQDMARRYAAAEEAIAKHGLDRFEAALAWWEAVGRTEEPQGWRSIILWPDGLAPTEKCDRVELALSRIDRAAGRKPGKTPVAPVAKTFTAPAKVEAI